VRRFAATAIERDGMLAAPDLALPEWSPARRSRQRPWGTYTTVGEWFRDYQGFVPIQLAAGLDRYMRNHDVTFREAYRALLKSGAIIPLVSSAGLDGDRDA